MRVQPWAVGAMALEQPGVEQEPCPGGLEQVHRAGHLARGAPEGEADAAVTGDVADSSAPGAEQPVAGVAEAGQDVAVRR